MIKKNNQSAYDWSGKYYYAYTSGIICGIVCTHAHELHVHDAYVRPYYCTTRYVVAAVIHK